MDVRHVGDHECISCGKCMNACGERAIALSAGRLALVTPGYSAEEKRANPALETGEKKRRNLARALWAVALAVLVAALVYFNLILPGRNEAGNAPAPVAVATEAPEEKPAETEAPSPAEETASYESDAPIGNEVGQRLEDFTIPTLGGGEFHLSDARGSVTFINLWATYCGPCVQELPHFSKLKEEHPEISVLAVHSSLVTDDPAQFLAEHEDWTIDFAVDTEDDAVWSAVGGSSVLPQTIVLNAKGEVVYNQTGSVTYEKLEELLREAEG